MAENDGKKFRPGLKTGRDISVRLKSSVWSEIEFGQK